jgi:hypothetical protein
VPGYGVSLESRSTSGLRRRTSLELEVQAIVRSTWEPSTPGPHRNGPDSDLPRKEVIQPHLPVRLPCYDFVPITDPTFDGCLPCGLAHRLRVLPAFMT